MNKKVTTETQVQKVKSSENVELVRVSLDEFNLATFPVSVLDKKAQRGKEPLHFQDVITVAGQQVERHWKVFPHQEEGFPGPADDDVLMALFELTREQGGAKKIYFTRYQLCKKLGWPLNTFYYKRIESSFRKLAAVHIEATNAYGDLERKKFINMGFTIIQEYKLYDESSKSNKPSYVMWSDRIAASISQKLTKYLDASFYFDELETPLEKRLFRYLDNHFDQGMYNLILDIQNLCYEHLGVARRYRYISQLMQKLESPLQKLVRKGFLQKWRQEGQSLIITGIEGFASRVKFSIPMSEMISDISDDICSSSDTPSSEVQQQKKRPTTSKKSKSEASSQRNLFDSSIAFEISARGVDPAVALDIAERTAGRYEKEVWGAIKYFDSECAKGKKFDNPAGLLVSLIRKAIPPEDAPPKRDGSSKKTSFSTPSRTVVAYQEPYQKTDQRSDQRSGQQHDPLLFVRGEIEYQKYLSDFGRESFESLTIEEQLRMFNEMQKELKAGPHASKFRRMPADKFTEHIRFMIESELSRANALPFDAWFKKWQKEQS
ncbi:MAG: replication initiator protein A [Blastocatellia bacterium]|nr:replication initiator protein A [Blastocatellia bacterium]